LGLADLLSNLAKMEREARRPAAGAALQREVLAIRRFLGDEDGEARSLHEIGVCLLEAGDRDGGLSALNEALALRRRRDDRPGAITTLKEVAQAQAAAGDTSAALASLNEARALATSISDARMEAEVLRQSGEISLRGGRNDTALAACQASHNQFVAVKDKEPGGRRRPLRLLRRSTGSASSVADALLGVVLSAARGMSDKSLEASALIEVTAACVATRDLLRSAGQLGAGTRAPHRVEEPARTEGGPEQSRHRSSSSGETPSGRCAR
jgi:tetratricopeptide (TPR) repeat protein